jgi:hypothetical protein
MAIKKLLLASSAFYFLIIAPAFGDNDSIQAAQRPNVNKVIWQSKLHYTGADPTQEQPHASGDNFWPLYLAVRKSLTAESIKLKAIDPSLRASDSKELTCYVSLKPDGSISQMNVSQTSGVPVLDEGALELIRKASPFCGRGFIPNVPQEGDCTICVHFTRFPDVDLSTVNVGPSGQVAKPASLPTGL